MFYGVPDFEVLHRSESLYTRECLGACPLADPGWLHKKKPYQIISFFAFDEEEECESVCPRLLRHEKSSLRRRK